MTAQEIFTTVVTHLRGQGTKAQTPQLGCVYRGPHNTKCAVGCLIPDALYTPNMEGTVVGCLPDKFPALGFLSEHLDLLHDLQVMHDDSNVEEWECRLESIANAYTLELPPC